MLKVEEGGHYLGRIPAQKLGKSSGGCVQLYARCVVSEREDPNTRKYSPVDPEREIVAFLNLSLLNGDRNVVVIDSLKEALGWDGEDLKALRDGDYSEKEVRITVGPNAQRDDQLEVKWINPVGGFRKSTAEETSEILSIWKGIKLPEPDVSHPF